MVIAYRPQSLWECPPSPPWALHSTALLGNLTERWIEQQASARRDYDARLVGLGTAPGAARDPAWLVTRDRFDLMLSYRGMYKSGGLSLMWLAGALRAHRPAVVHAHFGFAAAQHRHFARALGAPLVASFYGKDATMRTYTHGGMWRLRYSRLFRDASAVLVEGPAMGARVARLGCPEDKLHVVPLPADESSLARIPRAEPDVFRVIAAGRFVEKKGFDTAIVAFARALRGRDAELVIMGGGPLEGRLRQLARDLRVEKQVVWKQGAPFHHFMREIAAASVAVFPSRQAADGDSEGGAPVTLIESQWLGVPVLASSHDDLPYVCSPGGSTILPPTDVDAWSDALAALHDQPARLVTMGAAARDHVRSRHAPSHNAALREAVYTAVQ